MLPWKILILAGACAGCAGQPKACPKPEVEIQTQTVDRTVVHYVSIQPRLPPKVPHSLLISTYQDTLNQEKAVAIHAKNPGVIIKMLPLDTAAKEAMAPILDPLHVATPLEVKRAIVAEGALAAYLNSTTKGSK